MAVEVTNTTPRRQYPMVKRYKLSQHGTIVLFTERDKGIVLSVGIGPYTSGVFFQGNEDDYEVYQGTITIQNQLGD